jgi:hypothetical protein
LPSITWLRPESAPAGAAVRGRAWAPAGAAASPAPAPDLASAAKPAATRAVFLPAAAAVRLSRRSISRRWLTRRCWGRRSCGRPGSLQRWVLKINRRHGVNRWHCASRLRCAVHLCSDARHRPTLSPHSPFRFARVQPSPDRTEFGVGGSSGWSRSAFAGYNRVLRIQVRRSPFF